MSTKRLLATENLASASQTKPNSRRRIRHAISLLIVMGLAIGGWWCWREYRCGIPRTQGEEAFRRTQFVESLRLAQEALRIKPNDASSSLLAARNLIRLRRAAEAEPFYRQAGSLSRELAHERGMALLEAQELESASAVYEDLLIRWPDDRIATRRLGAIWMSRQNWWDRALSLAKKQIAIAQAKNPADVEGEVVGLALAATVYHNQSDYSQSVPAFERILTLDANLEICPIQSQIFDGYYCRGLLKLGRVEDAKNRLLRIDLGRHSDLRCLLAQVHKFQGHLDLAESCWRGVLAQDPKLSEPWLELGKLALTRNQLTEAVECLTKAVELAPASIESLYNLVQAYVRLGRKSEAEQLQKRVDALKALESPVPSTKPNVVGPSTGFVSDHDVHHKAA